MSILTLNLNLTLKFEKKNNFNFKNSVMLKVIISFIKFERFECIKI